jgi:nucleotide-binding universal stress UspA family protein
MAAPLPEEDRHRVVVGVDGSDASKLALAAAARQASLSGATLEVVSAWSWPGSTGWTLPLPDDYDPDADATAMVDGLLAPVRQDHPDLDIITVVGEGGPADLLVKASDGADLLVVGSRGHGGFTGMLLGSVSEHCTKSARCPVMVVRDAH